jgi:DNA-binding CsgD family transcriptional regulator
MNHRNFDTLDTTDVGWRDWTPTAIFAAIALLIGFDILADYRSGTNVGHVLTEALVMALAVAGAAVLWQQLRTAQRQAEKLTVDLVAARNDAERFREEARDALRGLGEAIDAQFTRWGLTAAERDVGLLLLKGLSHKEVATARSTSETTIRQQALAIYRKSGLRNRSDLSAFFLEDLLLPVGERCRRSLPLT